MRKQVGLRLSEEFLARLDLVRGGVPREVWIRGVLAEAVGEAVGAPRDGVRSPGPVVVSGAPRGSSEATDAVGPAGGLSRAERFARATQKR